MTGPVLVAGGTGTLGIEVVRRLTAGGQRVRVLSRDRARARRLAEESLVEVETGDVRDARAVARAMRGVTTVVSAVQGFAGAGGSPRSVDHLGNANLIREAARAGVGHFILISVVGADPSHPMELMRMKHAAEGELRASALSWTIIRSTAFMETWVALLAEPLATTGKTKVFGRGQNPVNFVSAHDVARYVDLAVSDAGLRGSIIEVGGPENLTMRQLVGTFASVTGRRGRVHRIPRPMMRIMAVLLRLPAPSLARQISAGVVMDTRDMTFDTASTAVAHPSIQPISLAEMIKRDHGGPSASEDPDPNRLKAADGLRGRRAAGLR